MIRTLFTTIIMAATVGSASAATTNLCPDTVSASNRTTVTGSTCVLGKSKAEVEAGYTNLTVDGLGNLSVYPQATLRVGTFAPRIEADLTLPSYARIPGLKGTSDLNVGAKYALATWNRYAVSARASADLPTGTNGFGSNGTSYSGGLVGTYAASPALRLSASSDAQAFSTGFSKYGATREGLAADLAIYPTTHLTGGYALQTNALGADTTTRPTYQVGVSHQFGKKAVIDFALGRDQKIVTGQDRYVSAGFTYQP